jgi:hypothetical protein
MMCLHFLVVCSPGLLEGLVSHAHAFNNNQIKRRGQKGSLDSHHCSEFCVRAGTKGCSQTVGANSPHAPVASELLLSTANSKHVDAGLLWM